MGQNNRRHRAAKVRHRQATQSRARPHTSGSGHTAESLWTPSAGDQRRQLALDALATLARDTAILASSTLPFAVRRTLSGLDQAVVSELEGLLVAELLARVSAAWERGWQPQDLRHGASRGGGRQSALAADLITRHALASSADRLAPPAWREQLDTIAGAVADPGEPNADWRPVSTLMAQGVPQETAWTDALGLLKTLAELPRLPLLLPPPSQWSRGAQAPKQTSTPDRDRLLSRIRALLAKAEATNHPAEAEAFTAKAQELMSRHAIDEALLHAQSEESMDLLTRRVHLGSPYASTKVLLLTAVARANRSRAIYLSHYAIASVVGTPVDVDQVELLFTSLLIQATRAMSAAGARRAGSFDRSPTFRRSFLTAYADRIGERLVEADHETVASYGAELVPVLQRQAEAVDAEFARQFPHTTTLNTGYLDPRGWQAGREAADRAVFVAGRLDG